MYDLKGVIMTKENDGIKSHASNISRDELIHLMAEYAVNNKISPERVDRVIADFAIESINHQPHFWLSGSIYRGFEGNPQDYLMTKVIKVGYGTNGNMIIGNLVHHGRDVAVKYKLNERILPSLISCIRAIKDKCHELYAHIRPDEIKNSPKVEVFKTSCKLFKLYYEEILPNNKSIASELSTEVSLPFDMFKNPSYANLFSMTGIIDDVSRDDNNFIVIGDLKTSAKKISGKSEMNPILEKHFQERSLLRAEVVTLEKQIKKFVNSEVKLSEAQLNLSNIGAQLADAKSKGKAIVSLTKRIKKWESELSNWIDNNQTKIDAEEQVKSKKVSIEELNEVIKPLEVIYNIDKANADLEECRKLHEAQLAHYALGYMFVSGEQPKTLRVENIVKNVTPEVQIFEWELTESILEAAEERISSIIQLIELMLSGVDPLILFRASPDTHIGSETEKFKTELREIIKTNLNQI